jgi:hypothetical protein
MLFVYQEEMVLQKERVASKAKHRVVEEREFILNVI